MVADYEERSKTGLEHWFVTRLGEVLAIAGDTDRYAAEGAVRPLVTPAVLEEASLKAVADRRRFLHILSIGTKFIWEEWILLLTLRLGLEHALNVMALFGVDTAAFDLPAVDAEMRTVAAFPENRRAFLSALATVRKNCGVPFIDRWSA